MSELLEAAMLVCFGLSWPLNAYKNFKAATAAGSSWQFIALITTGYMAGIAAKFASGSVNWVLAVYLINLACIGVNWIVYFRNRRLDAQRFGHAPLFERRDDAAPEPGFDGLQHDGLRGYSLVPRGEGVGQCAIVVAAYHDVGARAFARHGSRPVGQGLRPCALVADDGVAQRLRVAARSDQSRGVHPGGEQLAVDAVAFIESSIASTGFDDVLHSEPPSISRYGARGPVARVLARTVLLLIIMAFGNRTHRRCRAFKLGG